ncbi:tRNA (N6-isopentenyl adenosine(37)-C2)-methylthiotransferase MiaB [Peredibacter starrii]|uniref:tRNA-2-methylthio-N(6)-dimethylallyladenosine synthase n=1 Tax=Peredibacter starrii TaxID=28202 RepID=A0AAX4HMQ5_9BACT|nr:tRNA (N6-isopentenyl adenosine(37)-C2)-methylthiotransferase MiaB [Peredibacter starrii]WPU64413.1 tRNA (N6-isopentenyl adenosine(37)-C2)-methylthiotransferase MiaB [Peredibacter starrii]
MENTTKNDSVKVGELEFPPRKVWMKTYGCQMNYHDSERIMSHLSGMNFTKTEEQSEADLVIFNTCAVRDLANQKFYSHLGETKKLKTNPDIDPETGLKKNVIVAAGGCIAQTEGKDLVQKYKQLDFAFGTDVIDNIGEMVYRAYAGEKKFTVTAWDRSDNYSIETKITQGTPQAFVNIIKGCDKFCSYCIVPFTRGREKSRRLAEVVTDVKRLVEYSGIQEVMLLGQNVNSFGKDNGESLGQLIMELEKVNGLHLLRYTTSHPYDVTDDLVEAHANSKKLANHLHLPVQSGSNTVLQRMLREYTVEHYLSLLAKMRKANPEMVITSDIIAGFPNETEEEHQQTLQLLKDAQFDNIYAYAYSSRKGTKAARMNDVLTDDIRGRRLREVMDLQLSIQAEIRRGMTGKTYRVLVDGKNINKGVQKWQGRTSCNRIVHFEPANPEQDYMWNWVDVEITSATALSTQGTLIKEYGKTL